MSPRNKERDQQQRIEQPTQPAGYEYVGVEFPQDEECQLDREHPDPA